MKTMPSLLHALGAILVMASALLLSACGSSAPPLDAGPAANAPLTLQPGDRVRLTVWGQDQMNGEYMIERDGAIALPLAGRITIANLPPSGAEAAIGRRLKDGLVIDPKVTVDVVQFRPVYVVGEVTHPGAYDYTSNIDVINAIALAGGYTYRAKKSGIELLRGTKPNQKTYQVSETTPLLPGDVVVVPERFF